MRSNGKNFKKYIIVLLSISAIFIILITLMQPVLIKAIWAKYKSTDHFLTLQIDRRIRYEASAENNAFRVSRVLSESQYAVEHVLKAKFKKPISVYVCASQDSFNEYVFLSKNVVGAVYWGKLFLSPNAFHSSSIGRLLNHELTHYLFYTHLGDKAHIEKVPLWFREGIAEFVANGGQDYTKGKEIFELMNENEVNTYLSGELNYWFLSQDASDAVTKNGVVNRVSYRVGGLFVHFIYDLSPKQFNELIQLLLTGIEFSDALQSTYEKSTHSLLKEFSHYLTQESGLSD